MTAQIFDLAAGTYTLVLCAILLDRSFLREIDGGAAGADLPHDSAGMIFLKTLFNCQAAIFEITKESIFGIQGIVELRMMRYRRFK